MKDKRVNLAVLLAAVSIMALAVAVVVAALCTVHYVTKRRKNTVLWAKMHPFLNCLIDRLGSQIEDVEVFHKSWSQSGGWKGGRTMEEKIYGKDEF